MMYDVTPISYSQEGKLRRASFLTCGTVCSRQIDIELEGDTVRRVQYTGGCHGNTQGLSALCVGMKKAELIARLRGIDCKARGTSCPDQLARALEKLEFYVSDPLDTAPEHFETPLQRLVYETFAAKGIPFSRVDTDPGITMEDCRHISARIGVPIVKTIFLCNRQQTEFYLYVSSDSRPFVTRDFCSALGISRVSFASAEQLWDLTGAHAGAATILSGVLPAAAGVHLVMDASIARAEWFACTDGTPTCFVKIRTSDLLDQYLKGREVKLIAD